MKKLLVITLLFTPLLATSQEQSFIYSRKSGVNYLATTSDTLTLKDYKVTNDKIRNREAIIAGETYILSIAKTKEGRMQTFTDSKGVKQASVNLGNYNRYDITLPDGRVLDCKISGRTFTYTTGNKDVMKASLKRVEGKKMIFVNNLDPEIATPAVLLSCMERGTDKYISSRATVPLIIAGVITGIAQALARNSQPDNY